MKQINSWCTWSNRCIFLKMRKQHILPEIKSGICSMYNCIAILWLHSWLRRDHFSYSQGQGSHWVRIMDHCGPLNTTLLNWSLSHVLNYVINIFSMLLDNFENEPALPTHAEKSSADTRCQIHSHIALLRKTFFFKPHKREKYTPLPGKSWWTLDAWGWVYVYPPWAEPTEDHH